MLQVLVEQNSSQTVASRFQKVQTLYLRYLNMLVCFCELIIWAVSFLVDVRLFHF